MEASRHHHRASHLRGQQREAYISDAEWLSKGNGNCRSDWDVVDGEFGGILQAVFEPSSKTNFEWKERGLLGSAPVDVFDYRAQRENSTLLLLKNKRGRRRPPACVIFIDSATHDIRRIIKMTDSLPKNFFIEATSISVDYDYIAINSHDFLLPVKAQVGLKERGRKAMLNEIEFRDYRRFGSKTRITPLAKRPDRVIWAGQSWSDFPPI